MSINSLAITQFPEEILVEFFSYLDVQSLCKTREACKQFLELASSHHLWQSHFYRKFPKATLQSGQNKYFELFKQWSGYWKKGAANEAIVQSDFPGKARRIALHGDLVITSNLRAPICIWNHRTQESVCTLQGRFGDIKCFAVYNNTLISAFESSDLEVWNWPDQKLLYGFQETTLINAIVMNDTICIFGTYNQNIPILDYHAQIRIGNLTLSPSYAYCECLALHGDVVAAGTLFGTVYVWNWRTQECLITLTSHKSSPSCITVQESGLLVFGCGDKTICVWNWKTAQDLFEMNKHQERPTSLALQGDIVISSSCHETTLLVWNWRTQEHLATLDVGQKDIKCLALQGDTLACGAAGDSLDDKGLVMWKTHQPENTEHLHKSRRLA